MRTLEDMRDWFWQRVEKTDSCWLWTGARNKLGYGIVSIHAKKHMLAHRVAWLFTHGDIPGGMILCHRCDTPRCVRPEHVFLGTRKDNMQDARRKALPRAGMKLTESQAMDIINRLISWEKVVSVARATGVSPQMITRINSGLAWTHLYDGSYPIRPIKKWVRYPKTIVELGVSGERQVDAAQYGG